MKQPFYLFSGWHIMVLAVCFLLLFLQRWYLRNWYSPAFRLRDIRIFTLVFLCIELALVGSKIMAGEWQVAYNLPLHLCDISALTILLSMHLRRESLFQLGYYWGVTGGLMALLVPNIQFVDWYFFPFFIWHLFLIAGPYYLYRTERYTLPYSSIWRAWGVTLLLCTVMYGVNHVLGSNYMFVNEKISSFEALGLPDFPAYLPWLAFFALGLFHLLWFAARRR